MSKPVWSWTEAVANADVAPLTKLVCLNLARHFSSTGKGWRVSVADMMKETGLSNRSMATHLKLAEDAKLLIIKREPGPHGQRGVTTYVPCFPDDAQLKREAEVVPSEGDSRGPSEPASLRPREPGSRQVSFQEKPFHKKEEAPPERIWVDQAGAIQLGAELTAFWLPEFDGDPERLRLALIEAAGYVKTNSPYPLEAQVSSQLARRVRARKDREARKQNGGSPAPRRKSKSDEARDFLRAIGIDPEPEHAR